MNARYFMLKFISNWVDDDFCTMITKLSNAHDKLVAEGGSPKILRIIVDDKIAYHSYVIEQAYNLDL